MDWLTELGGVGNLSAGAALTLLIVLVIRSIITGKLIPESMHDRIIAAKDDQIDTLQAQLEAENAQYSVLVSQLSAQQAALFAAEAAHL